MIQQGTLVHYYSPTMKKMAEMRRIVVERYDSEDARWYKQ